MIAGVLDSYGEVNRLVKNPIATSPGASTTLTAVAPAVAGGAGSLSLTVEFATLHTSDEDRIAVSYETAAAGDYVQLPDGRSERSETSRLFLGSYDRGSHALTSVTEITPAGTAWFAAAWIGDRFLLVNGTVSPVLSVFDFN